MEEDPLAAILGEKEEFDGGEFNPEIGEGSKRDSGADPEVLAPDLLAACKANDEGWAKDLLADGVSPGYSDPESGWSCLHWSVYNGNPVLTRALVRAGAASGYKRASATLTQAGYSPNDTDNMGNTATHLAAANGHERVLDTLIRDGADVHRQNKFKNTPHDVANSAECRGILRRAEAIPAPTAAEEEKMHDENLQRTLEVERVLAEVVGPLDPTEGENRRRKRQLRQQEVDGRGEEGEHDDNRTDDEGEEKEEEEEEEEVGLERETKDEAGTADANSQPSGRGRDDSPTTAGDGSKEQEGDDTAAEVRAADDVAGRDGKAEGEAGDDDGIAGASGAAEGKEDEAGRERSDANETEVKGSGGGAGEGQDAGGVAGGGGDGSGEPAEDVLAQVERIREAVAGAEALCICEDLVAAARLRIDGLLLQHSIEKQAARVAAEGPILTQQAYTTLVNRLMLLLRRAEGSSRISGKLKKRAKALVEKSHGEYWLQVSAQRLLKVECAEASHVPDMSKLEACIEKASKVGAQGQLVRDCRALLKRLTTEVEISKAITGFPTVRLPIDPMPKDYWQPEDNGHIEETEGFPLPPVDADGKTLDYVWVPSKSLRALSAACKRMSEALVGGEGLNPALVERGGKKLQEVQKELKVLMEKDNADRDKAIAVAVKAAKKKKKKGGGGKKKKK
eukprot:g9206.t1